MGIKKFMHENKLPLCFTGIALGLPLTILCIFSFMWSDGDTGITKFSYDLFGGWSFWIIIPALFMLFIGAYYTNEFRKDLKEFKSLIDIQSKATFIKKLDRIEELAWHLHPKYERIVIERKKKYKIR